jgi:hypothetical protein
MAKGRGKGTKDEGRYIITQANLDKKGKTNKKTKRNPLALKYLSIKGKELKEAGEALAREAKNKKKNVTAQS